MKTENLTRSQEIELSIRKKFHKELFTPFAKAIADKFGFASDMKAYKANPDSFAGNISDIAEIIRVAVTGRADTPDLWNIIHIIGEDKMRAEIAKTL